MDEKIEAGQYESGGYWRGRIWPHFVYSMAQTLWRNGYHKEAEQTADRLLRMMQIQPWLMENFNSDPEKIGKDGYDLSQPEYNWSESAAIELLLELEIPQGRIPAIFRLMR
jgi:glycogen debranching enzyme